VSNMRSSSSVMRTVSSSTLASATAGVLAALGSR
jgi:hypothetical protein